MGNSDHTTAAPAVGEANRYPFSFQGVGLEYFKIASVNLALTLLTLGLYSPWAKVRTRQYFYGNTLLDSAAFRYTANPVNILKGRLIAVCALVVYFAAQQFFPLTVAPLAFLLALIAPWAIMRSHAFNYANTEYRGLRFHLVSDLGLAYRVYGPPSFLIAALVSLGAVVQPGADLEPSALNIALSAFGPLVYLVLYPLFVTRGTQYAVGQARYGDAVFSLATTTRRFYGYYLVNGLLYLVATVVVFGGFFAITYFTGQEARSGAATTFRTPLNSLAGVGMAGLGIAMAAFVMASFKARGFNLVYNHVRVNPDVQLTAGAEVLVLARIYLVNYLAIVLTLGLAYPWARVRTARYLAGVLTLVSVTSLDGYVAQAERDSSATGEELGEVFDLGIGL